MSASGAPPPLGPHLRALVDAEQRIVDAEPRRMKSVLAAVESAIAASAPASAAAATAAAATGTSVAKVVAIAVTTFVLGAGTGAAVHHAVTTRAPEPSAAPLPSAGPAAVVASVAPPPAPSETAAVAAEPPATAASPPASAPRAVTSSGGAARPSASDIAQEQAIIDAARAGLASSRPDVALEAATRHERAFPHGQLAEERDALRILALARSGRAAEARARMVAFRRAHPSSALTGKLDQELAKP